MANKNKVAEKREENIEQAAKNDNWEEVSRLLDQPLANAERRDRAHGLLSLNKVLGKEQQTEFVNFIPDKVMNPLDSLIKKEDQINLNAILKNLNEVDQNIIRDHILKNKSFNKISKEIGLSDKTIKKRFTLALQSLKSLIK